MNQFFLSKVQLLRESIPDVHLDPLSKLREIMWNRTCTMKLKPVHPDDVMKVIISLKNSKSTGTDFLDTRIIKLVANEILPALTRIVNLSLTQLKFPYKWKQSKGGSPPEKG